MSILKNKIKYEAIDFSPVLRLLENSFNELKSNYLYNTLEKKSELFALSRLISIVFYL